MFCTVDRAPSVTRRREPAGIAVTSFWSLIVTVLARLPLACVSAPPSLTTISPPVGVNALSTATRCL